MNWSILSIIGFVCVVFLIVKFNRNKSKNKQATGKQLSASEKIISSLDTRIRKSLQNLADNTRTMDVVRDEIILAFEDAKEGLKNSSADYIISLKNAQANITNNVITYKTNIAKFEKKALEFKKRFEETKEQMHLDMAKEFIVNKLAYKESVDESNKLLLDIEKELEMFEMKLYRVAMSLDRKKLEIISNISKPVHNLNYSLSAIDSLYKEFNNIKDTIETKQKVDNIVDGNQTEDIAFELNSSFSNEEIQAELDKLA